MAFSIEGTVEIPLADYYEFILKYTPGHHEGGEIMFGPPVLQSEDLVIPFAASSECHPSTWAVPPTFASQVVSDGSRFTCP